MTKGTDQGGHSNISCQCKASTDNSLPSLSSCRQPGSSNLHPTEEVDEEKGKAVCFHQYRQQLELFGHTWWSHGTDCIQTFVVETGEPGNTPNKINLSPDCRGLKFLAVPIRWQPGGVPSKDDTPSTTPAPSKPHHSYYPATQVIYTTAEEHYRNHTQPTLTPHHFDWKLGKSR